MNTVKLNKEAAKKRCEKATPGPWVVRPYRAAWKWVMVPCDETDDGLQLLAGEEGAMEPTDADFIAHARTDLPAAVERIEELEGGLQVLLKAAMEDRCHKVSVTAKVVREILAGRSK